METLHRSKSRKVVFGVCGGLAEYFRMDPVLIRIICIIITIFGPGLIIYVVAALVMPGDKNFKSSDDQWESGSGTGAGTYSETGAYGTGSTDRTAGTGGTDTDSGSDFESEFKKTADEWNRPAHCSSGGNKLVIGTILVGLGVLILGRQFMPWLFDLRVTIPLLLIVIGGAIVIKGRR